jgi:hypothetical protein
VKFRVEDGVGVVEEECVGVIEIATTSAASIDVLHGCRWIMDAL